MLLFLLSVAVACYIAWCIGARDESMALLAGSGLVTIGAATLMGAVAGVVGAFLFSQPVEQTVSALLNFDPNQLGSSLILGSAASWLLLCSCLRIPISVAHSTIGAAIGFGIASNGVWAINWLYLGWVLGVWLLTPLLGWSIARCLLHCFARMQTKNLKCMLRVVKLCAICLLCLSILVASFRAGNTVATVNAFLPQHHAWLHALTACCIGMGMVVFGKRVVKRVGLELMELEPRMSLVAQLSVATVVGLFTLTGLPLSTAHVLIGSVVGVGMAKGMWLNVRALKQIGLAWFLTFPATACIAALLAVVI